MKAVRVLAPSGPAFKVFEVVVVSEGAVLSFIRVEGSSEPREVRGRYASLAQAVARNSRSTTTAEIVEVEDLQAARAMVEE